MADALTVALKGHDKFFGRVIETIPPELYKHTVSEDAEGAQEAKYAKNRKLPLTAEERKSISKAKKLEKYAPQSHSSTAVTPAAAEEPESENEDADNSANTDKPESTANLNDLRERLQARIQGMKAQRLSNKPQKENKNAKATNASAGSTEAGTGAKVLTSSDKKNKHKLEAAERQEAKRVRRVGTAINDATDVSILSLGSQESGNAPPQADADDLSINTGSVLTSHSRADGLPSDLHFSLIAQPTVLGEAAGEGELPSKTKPKGNKIQRLQRLLAEAEKKRQRMKQLTSHGGEEGLARLQGEKWNDALKAAKGERTIIVGSSSIEGSEGKLKAALKKIEKRKAKSAEKWGDRLAAVEDAEKVKIQKREGNLHQRRMKMKGIEVPAQEAATATTGEPIGPGSGRKRLYHVLKHGAQDEAAAAKGGDGKGPHKSQGQGKSQSQGNRAGFEGKKKEYLNKQ